MRNRLLPLAAAEMTADDIQAVTRVLGDGKLGSGDKVREFEAAVAKYVGARYAVAVSSGAAGLRSISPATRAHWTNCMSWPGKTTCALSKTRPTPWAVIIEIKGSVP